MIGSIVMVVAGGLVAAVGILGWRGKLPRNRLAGLRLSSTLRSDRAFRVANRAAGPATTIAGAAGLAGGAIGLMQPPLKAEGSVLIGALAMALFAVIGAIQGSRAANRLDD